MGRSTETKNAGAFACLSWERYTTPSAFHCGGLSSTSGGLLLQRHHEIGRRRRTGFDDLNLPPSCPGFEPEDGGGRMFSRRRHLVQSLANLRCSFDRPAVYFPAEMFPQRLRRTE